MEKLRCYFGANLPSESSITFCNILKNAVNLGTSCWGEEEILGLIKSKIEGNNWFGGNVFSLLANCKYKNKMRVPFSESQGANCIGLIKKKNLYTAQSSGEKDHLNSMI